MAKRQYKPFEQSNAAGMEREDRLAEMMDLGGAKCLIRHNRDFRFDQLYQDRYGLQFTVELKDEREKSGTGNVCFEYQQGNPPRPSCIDATQADVQIHEFNDSYDAFMVDELRRYVSDCKPFDWCRAVRRFGDNHNVGVVRPRGVMQYRWCESGIKKMQIALAVRRLMERNKKAQSA